VGRSPGNLTREFYERPTLVVAEGVLGKHLIFGPPSGQRTARIVEVEAYIGQDDPACHAARGMTKRNAVMFGPGGFAYVYLIYGMYHCLNIVTESEGTAAALLIRAAEPVRGFRSESVRTKAALLLGGPGKLCREFGITREHNGLDLTGDELYLEDHGRPVENVIRTERIGIKAGRDRLWRFCDADSPALSKLR
jgi:DNA-3-methyladenine glycosylase